MSNRRTALIVAGLAVATLAVQHPSANIRVITHDATDPSPHRIQAALDFGLIGVSVLYTWTVKSLR